MIQHLTEKKHFSRFILLLLCGLGGYLTLAWASYSPFDPSWTIANSLSHETLNKAGSTGAWLIDLLYAAFGKTTFIIPFSLMLIPLYLLLWGKSVELSGWRLFSYCSSFLAFLIGLAVLAASLFSPTASYLAGGFIGEMLFSELMAYLNLFGTLLVAMVLTTVGFYFCSGQTLLQLGLKLYHWIIAVDTHDNAPQQPGQNTPNFTTAPQQPELDIFSEPENAPETEQLTDVSVFTRPKIIGLKTDSAPTPPEPQENDILLNSTVAHNTATFTDPSQFIVPQNVTMPKIHLAEESTFERTATRPSEDENALNLPKVSLNFTPKMVETEPALAPIDDAEEELARQFAEAEQQRLAEMEARAKAQGLEQTFQHIVQESAPNVSLTTAPPKPATYPLGGYGESLIHPLLQRTKNVEKPTTPLPTLDLLAQTPPSAQKVTEQQIRETSAKIEKELANFGVKATVEDVLIGPVVTRYEILPAAGVKASKITSLDSDLARALMFRAIRITEVVPGKPYMGIETPNEYRETVWLRDVLDSPEFRHSKATLPMALGKDISGQPVVVDMAKMPHLLVAGQTGGGKSVGVNTMIASLLFKLTPEQVRFIMIDPKVVELSVYNDIPHLLTPVVNDMKKAANALRWAVEEMERRYLLISHLQVRNIEGYNAKIDQAAEMNLPIPNPIWRPGDSMDLLAPPLEKLSYIVLIVDEFADLMMTAGKQVEEYIMRIAQKARAVGIHLILATQRPSTDVITGVIKANIPSRIAFTVASQIDSRTILDKGGAELLLGRGDMLYTGAGSPDIIRIHGAFMSDDEAQRVADNWRARGKPNYLDSIVQSNDEEESSPKSEKSGDVDPMFDEVAAFVIESGVTSISGIQRRFPLGFNRAARIVDQLQEQGILSEPDSRGKREILAR